MTRAALAPLLSRARDDWNTPPEVRDALRVGFGGIEVDPCDNEGSILHAEHRIRLATPERIDALRRGVELPEGVDLGCGVRDAWPGDGLVFINPPFGSAAGGFVRRAIEAGILRDVVILLPARPDTRIWQDRIFPAANGICWWRGRLRFVGADHPAPFPIALVNLGHGAEARARFSAAFQSKGTIQ